jgi:transposase InsO family protein
MMCRLLEVSKSGFYAFRERPASARLIRDEAMTLRIEEVHRESGESYGSPRIFRALKAEGMATSRKRVARLMKQQGLRGKKKGRFIATTVSASDADFAPNLLDRNFSSPAPNRVWVSDLTAIWTLEGWIYLVVILDLFSRRVVAWSMAGAPDADLCCTTLKRALEERRPARGMIHHSDRGSQYTSHDYQDLLVAHGATPSMSRRGQCWDNAVAESFFASLKAELGITGYGAYRTHDEARFAVLRYIDGFYNCRRIHSTIGYVSPAEFERRAA